jgi:hemerythrin
MALLVWKDEFRLGIASVDHEHKELIDLINQLHDDLGRDRSSERVIGFLEEINAKILAHFALEEKVMRGLRYDELDAHKAEHERLLDAIRDIMDRYEAGAYVDLEGELSAHLAEWFGHHFATKDARLHHFLEERGIDEESYARDHPDA